MAKTKAPSVVFEEIPAKTARDADVCRWKTKGGRLDLTVRPGQTSFTLVRSKGGSLDVNFELGSFVWRKCDEEDRVEDLTSLALTLLPHMVRDEAFKRREWMRDAGIFETTYEHEVRQSPNADIADLTHWMLRARAVGIAEIRGRHAWREWIHAIRGEVVLFTDKHGVIVVGPRGKDVSKRSRTFTAVNGQFNSYLTSDMIARPIVPGEVEVADLMKNGLSAHEVMQLIQDSITIEERFGTFPRDSRGWLKGIDLSAI